MTNAFPAVAVPIVGGSGTDGKPVAAMKVVIPPEASWFCPTATQVVALRHDTA